MNITRYLGQSFERFPCLVLAVAIQRDRGHDIPDPATAPGESPPPDWYRHWRAVEPDDVRAWDVVEVEGPPGGPRSVGTLLPSGRVLTSMHGHGVLVLRRERFARRGVVGTWRPA